MSANSRSWGLSPSFHYFCWKGPEYHPFLFYPQGWEGGRRIRTGRMNIRKKMEIASARRHGLALTRAQVVLVRG